MPIMRAQHWTDVPLPGRGNRRRTMKNWCNFQEPRRPWRESNHVIEDGAAPPDNWDGSYDFKRRSLDGPMQAFLGDTKDVDNPAMVGCRLSAKPGMWLNTKAMNVRPGSVAQIVNSRTIRWPRIWKNTNLRYQVVNHKLVKTIRLTAPGHPPVFRFTIRVADGMTVEFKDNGARILDSKGVERMRLVPPWGRDSSTVNPNEIDGSKSIRVKMQEGQSRVINGRTYQVIRLVPNQDDLDGAVYPVEIDPTATISGTANIGDNMLIKSASGFNYGGIGSLYIGRHTGNNYYYTTVMRLDETQIPAGALSGFRLYFWRWSNAICLVGGNMDAYIIKDVNAWVEGTGTGQIIGGTSCWDWAQNNGLNWAGGHFGCRVSGNDYDADGSPPTYVYGPYTTGPDIAASITLLSTWAEAWRDITRLNQGIVLRSRAEVNSDIVLLRSTEAGSNEPYFEIDYAGAAAPVGSLLSRRTIQ